MTHPLTRAERRDGRSWYVAGCVALVAVALALRLYHLGAQSFWIDEISVTSFVRSGHLLSDLRDRGGPFEPPLHYLTVLAALHLPFGFEKAARIPSALFGGVEVLGLILLTREATNRRVTALLAGALLTVAPFVVRYGQENRYYVMFSALSLLSWWLVLRALRLRTPSTWIVYGVAAAAIQLTHPFAPLVLIVQALVLGVVLWRERGTPTAGPLRRGYLTAIGTGLLLILPWFAYGASDWIPNAWNGKSYAVNPGGQHSVSVDAELFRRGVGWLLGNSRHITLLVGLLLIFAVLAPLIARGRDRLVAASALAYVIGFVLVLVPLAGLVGTYFAYRRVESLVPPLLLLAAIAVVCGIDRLRRLVPKWHVPDAVGAVVIAALLALSLAATLSYYDTQKTNYRGLADIVRHAPRDGLVVIGPVDKRWEQLIPDYLKWQGVHRPVTFLVSNRALPTLPLTPGAVTWLTGASPNQPELQTRPLNDLESMQVIAGDRSGLFIILPWFASTSQPRTADELTRQRDAVAKLPPFLPALP